MFCDNLLDSCNPILRNVKRDKMNLQIGQKGDMACMTTGEILAKLRIEKNVGQKELATYLRVSVGTVSNYENDVHSPDLTTLSRLADYFEVTTDYLLGRTQYRFDPQLLDKHVSREYTVTDIINTVLTFDSGTVDQLMEYAHFLQTRH